MINDNKFIPYLREGFSNHDLFMCARSIEGTKLSGEFIGFGLLDSSVGPNQQVLGFYWDVDSVYVDPTENGGPYEPVCIRVPRYKHKGLGVHIDWSVAFSVDDSAFGDAPPAGYAMFQLVVFSDKPNGAPKVIDETGILVMGASIIHKTSSFCMNEISELDQLAVIYRNAGKNMLDEHIKVHEVKLRVTA